MRHDVPGWPVRVGFEAPVNNEITEYVNGKWLDGHSYSDETRFVREGFFVHDYGRRSRHKVVDLKGRHVIPPFSDAHSHYPDVNFGYANNAFLDCGVFYVLNANDIAEHGNAARARCFTDSSIDAIFAHAGFTCSDGHPADVYQLLQKRAVSSIPIGELEGKAYHAVDCADDLAKKWPNFIAGTPDLVKLYLLGSQIEQRDSARGLTPTHFRTLVACAQSAGLRTGVHVETAADFRMCLAAGVDLILHLPGYRLMAGTDPADYVITPDDAALAASGGIVVVTTASLLAKGKYPTLLEVQRQNLNTLKAAGVPLAVGSDRGPGWGILREIRYLKSLELFSTEELLEIVFRGSARAIFPARQVGDLSIGSEASFLVIDGNPLEDFESLFRVRERVKLGRTVTHALTNEVSFASTYRNGST